MHILEHLRTVNRHRHLVRKYCFRLGLYWQGLTHDLSKYSPREFWVGAKYFTGTHSPNDGERRDKGYSSSWLHHKGRNKHHFEYWTDYSPVRGVGVTGVKMPVRYVAEMFCDRLAACHIYHKEAYTDSDPYDYFQRSRHLAGMHEETAALLEGMLLVLKEQGEDAAFAYVRKLVQEDKAAGRGASKQSDSSAKTNDI